MVIKQKITSNSHENAIFDADMTKILKGKTIRGWMRATAAALVVFVAIFVFSRSETLSEWYMQTVYPVVAAAFSAVSNLIPFSIYDVFVVLGILCYFAIIVRAILRKKSFPETLSSLLRLTTVLVAWFYFAWGIAYFRKDFYARCGVEETRFDRENFKQFAARFIEDANRAYVDFDTLDKTGVRQKIEASYKEKHALLAIAYPNGKRRPKPMLFEQIYSKMGISGYFGPFFNEIHVSNYVMDFDYPFTLAHEMAHQFGIALESEANLYAFIVCANSSDPAIKYSAYNALLIYVLNDVYAFLPAEADGLRAQIRPEIMADLKANRAHWLAARDKTLSGAQDKVYDAYLKTNKISSGRENYSEVVGLVVSFLSK